MELKYITEFVTLVDAGKFSEAAERLYISQSSLSKHMKTLEEELGVPLFERETKRKVQLSSYGKLYLPYAEQISILHHEYLTLQKKQQREAAATLNIGSIPAMAQYRITDLLAEFQKKMTGVILNVEELESALSVEKVLQGRLDFAFVREHAPQAEDSLCRLHFSSDVLCAVLPAGHRLANQSVLSLAQLENEDFLLLQDSSFMYEMCILECERVGIVPNIVHTGSRGENIVNMVAQGRGVALLTRQPIAGLQSDKVRVVNIEPAIETEINLVYARHAQLSKEAKKFLSFFQQQFPEE